MAKDRRFGTNCRSGTSSTAGRASARQPAWWQKVKNAFTVHLPWPSRKVFGGHHCAGRAKGDQLLCGLNVGGREFILQGRKACPKGIFHIFPDAFSSIQFALAPKSAVGRSRLRSI